MIGGPAKEEPVSERAEDRAGDLPPRFEATRKAMHRVAAHVMGRRRFAVCGRFGLRASPGGFATPAYGDGPETLRTAGGNLIRETTEGVASIPIAGSALRDLVLFAGADLRPDFSTGPDTPSIGDVDQELELDEDSAGLLSGWYDLAWKALDQVLATLPARAGPAVIQRWPEHFDVGTTVAIDSGARVNLGASPGDGYCEEPYLYVGPWGPERPGDPKFWNAPFGAALTRSRLGLGRDELPGMMGFFQAGLHNMAGKTA